MTPAAPMPTAVCTRCKTPTDATDNFCRVCGKSLKPGYGFLFTHTGIILMALIMGPFALPFVWWSKLLGPLAKIIYTVILGITGFYLVYSVWHVFQFTQQTVQFFLA